MIQRPCHVYNCELESDVILNQIRIPFRKLLTLLIRCFSKPMLTYTKQNQKLNKMRVLNWIFISLGRKVYLIEAIINNRFAMKSFKVQRKKHKHINPELALEKGVEAFHQILLYALIIGIPLWEMNKSWEEARSKEEKLEQRIKNLEQVTKEADQHLKELKKIRWNLTLS